MELGGFPGFVASDDPPANLSRPATPTSMGHTSSAVETKSPEDINSDRLHLILGEKLGVCVKAADCRLGLRMLP